MEVGRLIYKINTSLMSNQKLMKLLKFDTPDALDKDDLTEDEINELFYGNKGEETLNGIKNKKRIFNQMSNPEILTDMRSEVRFYPRFEQQYNLTKVMMFFEVIVHEDIENLQDYDIRSVEITREIHKSLRNCNAIGKINFNNDFVKPVHFAKSYYGYMFVGETRLSRW